MKKSLMALLLATLCLPTLSVSAQEVELIETYPSDPTAFTQGLEMTDEGDLLLGTGMYADSRLGILDPETGAYDVKVNLARQYFGEGITVKGDTIWQLTWQEGKVFCYDLNTFEEIASFDYEGEGWGLAYDADRDVFWMSDGSHRLQKRNSEDFSLIETVEYTNEAGQPLELLNELEYANGSIYANVWYEDKVYELSPEGEVLAVYDIGPLLEDLPISDPERQKMDTLNGIAHLEGDRFLLTGKYYPVLLEVNLNR